MSSSYRNIYKFENIILRWPVKPSKKISPEIPEYFAGPSLKKTFARTQYHPENRRRTALPNIIYETWPLKRKNASLLAIAKKAATRGPNAYNLHLTPD
jgi:hypothetical protein